MTLVKKIFATLITLSLLGQTSINSFASTTIGDTISNDSEYIMEAAGTIKASLVSNVKGGADIANKIDTFVGKISSTQTKILKEKALILKKRIKENQEGTVFGGKQLSKEDKTLLIIDYLLIKTEEKLLNQEDETKKDLFSEYSQTLTTSENKRINTELIKIQKNILQTGVNSIENIVGEFEKYSNYEERGDFNAHINIDHELIGKIKAELELGDYTIKNSNFNSQITTKVKTIIDSLPRGEEAIKLELTGFLDFILKDQNYYILLKDLQVTDQQGIEKIEAFLEMAKEIAIKNKYIHFEDKNSAQVMDILKNLTPLNILNQGKVIVSKPLFKAYKKDGNKYYLIPTKYACDTAKELTNKFDPFNGKTCTTGQYQDLLKDIADTKAEFFIELGTTHTTIGFEANSVKDMETFTGEIIFSDKYIEEILLTVIPDQKKYPKEGASIAYNRESSLNGYLYADNGDVNIRLSSLLDKRNNFSSIDLNIITNDFIGDLYLKNKKISGKYNADTSTQKLVGLINGSTTSINSLGTLTIKNQIVNTGRYSTFDNVSELKYNRGDISFSNIYTSEGTQSDFNIEGSWDTKKKILEAGKLELVVKQKDSNFDFSNYQTTYSGDFKEVFDSQIKLNNKNIIGETRLYKNNETLLSISHSGKYEKDFIKLDNSFSSIFPQLLFGTKDSATGNINFSYDRRNNSNDSQLYIDMTTDSEKVLEFKLDNNSKRTYKNTQINAPKNTIPLEDLIITPKY